MPHDKFCRHEQGDSMSNNGNRPCAPIALFCYRRPDHLRQVLDALLANAESAASPLVIFCDGPRSPADEAGVLLVRELVRQVTGFASVECVFREHNLGLADSIITGVTDVVSRYGSVIVLEDDTVVSPCFLKYMNDALVRYQHDERVISIHGYLPPVTKKPGASFFLKGADCWGWATWARGWREFRPDGQALLNELIDRQLIHEFDLDGAYPYTAMLEEWTQGRNDSWAIRWHASAFLKGLLTLYPSHSLVVNIGNDGSGTHSGSSSKYETELRVLPVSVECSAVHQHDGMRNAFRKFYLRSKAPKSAIKHWLWTLGVGKKKKIKRWKQRFGWFKTSLSWSRAMARCSGYDSGIILEKCRDALLQVQQGKAVYERDSVLFDRIEYSWPLLAGLMTVAARSGGSLHVLDVGGSLGSTFFQNRRFLACVQDVKWHIVEQPQFVRCGVECFQNEHLKFHESIDDCFSQERIDAVLVASTLQYVERPYEMLQDIVQRGAPFVLFDRTTFSHDGTDVLAIQKVDPAIYPAAYPTWILSRQRFMDVMLEKYDLLEEFYSLNHPLRLQDGKKSVECSEEGFVFVRKDIERW